MWTQTPYFSVATCPIFSYWRQSGKHDHHRLLTTLSIGSLSPWSKGSRWCQIHNFHIPSGSFNTRSKREVLWNFKCNAACLGLNKNYSRSCHWSCNPTNSHWLTDFWVCWVQYTKFVFLFCLFVGLIWSPFLKSTSSTWRVAHTVTNTGIQLENGMIQRSSTHAKKNTGIK